MPNASLSFHDIAGGDDRYLASEDEEKRVAAWTALFEKKHEEAMLAARTKEAMLATSHSDRM